MDGMSDIRNEIEQRLGVFARPGAKDTFADATVFASFLRLLDYAGTAIAKNDHVAAQNWYSQATKMITAHPDLNRAGSSTRNRWLDIGERIKKARQHSRHGEKAKFSAQFEVGRVYEHNFIGDSDARVQWKVLTRTASTMTIKQVGAGHKDSVTGLTRGEEKRVKINSDAQGEFVYPMGRYSMAPILRASRSSGFSRPGAKAKFSALDMKMLDFRHKFFTAFSAAIRDAKSNSNTAEAQSDEAVLRESWASMFAQGYADAINDLDGLSAAMKSKASVGQMRKAASDAVETYRQAKAAIRASRAGAKAAFAIPPQVMQSWKFHTSKMTDLLRQFQNAARKSFGDRFDPSWLAEHTSIIRSAISALHNGRVKESTKQMRSWADDFTNTYAHHEHTRNLAMLAREIAREPAHVLELAESQGVKMSRPGAKAKFSAAQGWISGTQLGREFGREIADELGRGVTSLNDNDIDSGLELLARAYESEGHNMVTINKAIRGWMVYKQAAKLGQVKSSRPGAKATHAAVDSRTELMLRTWIRNNFPKASNADFNKILSKMLKQYGKDAKGYTYGGGFSAVARDAGLMSRPGAKATAAKPDDKTECSDCETEQDKAGLKLMEKADKAVSDKIRTLIKEGKPQDQAVAIALDMKRRGEL